VLGFARLVLSVGGTAALVSGALLIGLGLFAGAWLHALLPPLVIDARAVGGAAFALGIFAAAAGVVQLATAAWVGREGRWVTASAAVLAGIFASLLVACAVAAATEAARGGSAWFLGGTLALLIAATAYGAAAWGLSRASVRTPGRPS